MKMSEFQEVPTTQRITALPNTGKIFRGALAHYFGAPPSSADGTPSRPTATGSGVTSIAPNPNAVEETEDELKRKKKTSIPRSTVLSSIGNSDTLG